MDLDDTLVAQEFATSSMQMISIGIGMGEKQPRRVLLTCTVIVGIEEGKDGTDAEDVVVLVERHLDRGLTGSRSVEDKMNVRGDAV